MKTSKKARQKNGVATTVTLRVKAPPGASVISFALSGTFACLVPAAAFDRPPFLVQVPKTAAVGATVVMANGRVGVIQKFTKLVHGTPAVGAAVANEIGPSRT